MFSRMTNTLAMVVPEWAPTVFARFRNRLARAELTAGSRSDLGAVAVADSCRPL
jgi:hypothetical protein